MRFEAGNVSTLVTAVVDAPLAAIRAPATEIGKLRELTITLTTAVATRLGLMRALAVSLTPSAQVFGQNRRKGSPASGTSLVSAWVTAPTRTAATYMKRLSLPASIGAGITWSWPDDPLEIGDGAAISELILVNLVAVAPSPFEYSAIWED